MAIALHEPTFDSSDEAAVIEALRSTWVSTGGPFIDRFEKEIAEFVGAKYAIAVANGTLGLNLALEVMKRQSGVLGAFEVIVPTLSFAATFNSVLSTGGVPILMDAAIGSMQLDVANVECHIKSGYFFNTNEKLWVNKKSGLPLLAVMPAHIMGYGCNILALNDLCKELNYSTRFKNNCKVISFDPGWVDTPGFRRFNMGNSNPDDVMSVTQFVSMFDYVINAPIPVNEISFRL